MKTSLCMCCGKAWSGHRLYRKNPKTESSKHHNAFCSRQCAKKYLAWESDKNARCGTCGKATGKNGINLCKQCDQRNDWSALGSFASIAWDAFGHEQDPWEKRCNSAAVSLKIRQQTQAGMSSSRKDGNSWDMTIKRELSLMIQRAKMRCQMGWEAKICNAANLLSKRQRRKRRPPN